MIEEKENINSNLIAHLSLKESKKIYDGLIYPKIKEFFLNRNITKYEQLNTKYDIADIEFKKTDINDFFYGQILKEIQKNTKTQEFEIIVKYSITLDEENCTKTCEATGIKYDEILIYKQPIFYFIYLDIKDVFKFLREEHKNNLAQNKQYQLLANTC